MANINSNTFLIHKKTPPNVIYATTAYIIKEVVFMDYKYIESLVKLAKGKDIEAQELLVEEFKPIIYGLTKKSPLLDMKGKILLVNAIGSFLTALKKSTTPWL